MEQIEAVDEGGFLYSGLQRPLGSTRRSTARDNTRASAEGGVVDLVSIHQLERIMRVEDIRTQRDDAPEISHGIVKYNNTGAELVMSPNAVRVRLQAANVGERRIISSRDSGIGRLISMSMDVPKVRLDGRCELMDGAWPALLTVLVWNQMRVIDVVLTNFVRAEDNSEFFDVRPWSDRDRAVLSLLDDSGNRMGKRSISRI
jgi:hypothetical protein